MVDPDKALEAAGKGIDLARDAGQFLDKIFGEPAREVGGLLSDQIRFWRAMRMLNLKQKFEDELGRRGLTYEDIRALPLGQSVPLIEAASMEDSDAVQDLWAGLLASASDPHSGITMKKVYTALLKEIGPCEAALLDLLWKFPLDRQVRLDSKDALEAKYNDLAELSWRKHSEADRQSALGNLRRLGLIAPTQRPLDMSGLLKQVRVPSERSLSRTSTITTVDQHKMQRLIQWIVDLSQESAGMREARLPETVDLHSNGFFHVETFGVPEFSLILTPLGIDLLTACHGTGPTQTDGSFS